VKRSLAGNYLLLSKCKVKGGGNMAKNKGFDDFSKKLKKMEKSIEKYEGGKGVGFSELFTSSFMVKYTNFNNIYEFFDKSPFKVETQKDLEIIDEEELDIYVSKNTQFTTWESMSGKATKEHLAKQIRF
jgi:hypothetical protein